MQALTNNATSQISNDDDESDAYRKPGAKTPTKKGANEIDLVP
jgi:hypothetical protein